MNLKFAVNDYVLIWNLLFQASVSEEIHKLKQKLWLNYKNEYNKLYKDKELILNDPKNFIPNDDTIYNIVLETKEYEKLKKETEKYRNTILKLWDSKKKMIRKILKEDLRVEIDDYNVFIVLDSLNVVDAYDSSDKKVNTVIFGKKIDINNECKTLIELIYYIVKKDIKYIYRESDEVVKSIVELAILNELPTLLDNRSYYLTGDSRLDDVKRQIYPYWLMYLGATKEKMLSYMMRDKIAFEVDNYTYERQLKKVDLLEFINFCIRNKRHIIKNSELELI